MTQVWFTLGWIDVPSFTALMMLALGAGLLLTWLGARRADLPPPAVLDAALVGVLCGVIGARAMHVAANWDYYQVHHDQIAALWQGGLWWHGGLIGGLFGVTIAGRLRKLPLRRLLDTLTPGLMAGAVFGWLASYLAGVAYGREVFPGDRGWFLAADLPDIYGIWNPRLATQLIGAAWAGVCWVISTVSFRAAHEWSRGSSSVTRHPSFVLTMVVYSGGMFLHGLARGDAVPRLGAWRLDQTLDAVIVCLCLCYISALAAVRVRKRFSHARPPGS
jgi:prolipoprotein diacylglyceryltransferase